MYNEEFQVWVPKDGDSKVLRNLLVSYSSTTRYYNSEDLDVKSSSL